MARIRPIAALVIVLSLVCGFGPSPSAVAISHNLAKSTGTSPSASPSPSIPTVPAVFTFHGAGFGHGIGLSQYGAQGMAKDGFSATQIVTHYYPTTTVTAMPMPTNLAVGLLQDRSAANRSYIALRSEGVGGAGNPLIITMGSTKLTIPVATKITVGVQSGQVVVFGPNGIYQDNQKHTLSAPSLTVSWGKQTQGTKVATVVDVESASTSTGALANLGANCATNNCSHHYKYGTLTIKPYTSSTLNISNTLALNNEYLFGLGEVPSSWEPAALQAQVIAARSYAYSKYQDNKTLRSSCACHIYGTPADQNFVGFNKEISTAGANWVNAVRATTNKVVISGSRVIQAFFSSSTGGYSQPVKEVWGSSGYPWLTKVDDHWSTSPNNPNASWTTTFTQAQVVSKLRSTGINIKDVASFTVSDHYGSGGVNELTVADSSGRVFVITCIPTLLRPSAPNISPEGFRNLFNLKSTYVRSITASSTQTNGATGNKPDVLTLVNIKKWPKTNQYPLATFTINGTVSPIQFGVQVQLSDQQKGTWQSYATTKTDLHGAFTLTWPNVPAGTHHLRITATNSVGSVRSDSLPITLQGFITLSGPRSTHPTTVIKLTGTLQPTPVSVLVEVWRRIGKLEWRKIGHTYTNAGGNFTCSSKVGKRKATYTYRVTATDPQLGTATSLPLSVIIK